MDPSTISYLRQTAMAGRGVPSTPAGSDLGAAVRAVAALAESSEHVARAGYRRDLAHAAEVILTTLAITGRGSGIDRIPGINAPEAV